MNSYFDACPNINCTVKLNQNTTAKCKIACTVLRYRAVRFQNACSGIEYLTNWIGDIGDDRVITNYGRISENYTIDHDIAAQPNCAIVILNPQTMTDILETAQIVPRVTKDINKPVLCSFMGIVDVSEGIKYLEEHGIPNYAFPEAAVRSMASMAFYGTLMNLDKRQIRRVAAGITATRLLSVIYCV